MFCGIFDISLFLCIDFSKYCVNIYVYHKYPCYAPGSVVSDVYS